jgi:hypothetical protein
VFFVSVVLALESPLFSGTNFFHVLIKLLAVETTSSSLLDFLAVKK